MKERGDGTFRKIFIERDRLGKCLGVELIEARPGYARASLKIEEKHLNGGDVIHGGVLFSLADIAMAAAVNARGVLSFSIQSDIRFISNSGLGETVTVEAEEISIHKRLANYQAKITSADGKLLATFQGTYYRKDVPYLQKNE